MKQVTKYNPEEANAGLVYFTSQPDPSRLVFRDDPVDLQAAYLEDGGADLLNYLPIMGDVPSRLTPQYLSISGPQYVVGPEEYGAPQSQAPYGERVYGERVGYSDRHMVPIRTFFHHQHHQKPKYMLESSPTAPLWTPPTNYDHNFLSRPHELGMSWSMSSSPTCYGMHVLITLQLSKLINLQVPTPNARNLTDQILHPIATMHAPQHYVIPDFNHSTILKGLYQSAKFLWENTQFDRDICMQWLAGGRLWEQAVSIEAQLWKQLNQPEPTSAELATSLFDVFFDERNPHRCLWVTQAGICGHWISKRCLAQGHARKHFEYNPFPCGGKCGYPTWCPFSHTFEI
jgi:hypothetical protein